MQRHKHCILNKQYSPEEYSKKAAEIKDDLRKRGLYGKYLLMEKVFEKRKIERIIAVHRGHSYHARRTIERLTPRAKIVVLGSCGGYNNIYEVLKRAPQAHLIATKGTGTMHVNDDLLKMLNQKIGRGEDIDWGKFWGEAERQLGSNPNFASYIPPHRNLGVMFLKAYQNLTTK